jgi:hypothetical protein
MKKLLLLFLFFVCFTSTTVNAALVDAGDINFDGEVNILDAVLVQKHILGLIELSKDELGRADMNFDNEVNILDLVYIIKVRIMGIEDPEFSDPT